MKAVLNVSEEMLKENRLLYDADSESIQQKRMRPLDHILHLPLFNLANYPKSKNLSSHHLVKSPRRYFFATYLRISKATAATIIIPLIMSCQYGLTPTKVRP